MTVWGLVPMVFVLVLILLARRPPVQAAFAGALFALGLWFAGVGVAPSAALGLAMVTDTAVLFASIAAVMVPGLLLVVLLAQSPANAALSGWVQGLGLRGERQLLCIVLGIAPLLEAMTGFAVSLIATVPLLMALWPRAVALRVAIAGIVIAPWGTLGLATTTGAALLSMDARVMAGYSALVSAPVFVLLAALAVWLAGFRSRAAWGAVLLHAAGFVEVLYLASRWLGAEVAGMCAGAVVVLFNVLCARNRQGWPRAAWPYALLFACVMAMKLLLWLAAADDWLVWQGVGVRWKVLSSPGIPLALVAVVLSLRQRALPVGQWGQRVRRPLLTLLGFLLLSQIMVKAGFLEVLRGWLVQGDLLALPALAAFAGAAGGYLTGSNVGGNVLMLPALAGADAPVLAAVMNSACGHAVPGSLPMVALLAALAKMSAAEEQGVLRFVLRFVAVNTLLVALAGTMLVFFMS